MTECKVGFIDAKVREAYYDLKDGYSDEKQLFLLINQAIENIKKNHAIGVVIPKIVSIIVEWMDHKNYERRFKY